MTFSRRQQAKPVHMRKCLDCMGTSGEDRAVALSTAQGVPKRKVADDNQAKQVMCEDPCSSCGMTGAAYSNRQSRLPVHERKCLACMELAPDDNQAKQVTCKDPCSLCGVSGAAYSNRQSKV